MDGTHIEVRERGTRYVDYDTTADAVIALRILGERPDAARAATKFLLRKRSIGAYVHGRPYEKRSAVYVEPLAKLSLIAQWLPSSKRAGGLVRQLAALQDDTGGFDDRGRQADRSLATGRQAWAALALRAGGLDAEADRAVAPIEAVQCEDGSFAVDLTKTDCATGDTAATGMAVQAINGTHAGSPVAQADTTVSDAESAPDEGSTVLTSAAGYLTAFEARPEMVTTSTRADLVDWPAVGAIAAGRQAIGLDATYLADRTGRRLRPDGGVGGARHSDLESTLSAAPAVAGRSLLGATGSPLASESRALVDRDAPPVRAEPSDEPVVATWIVYGLAGLLAIVLVLTSVLLVQRILRRPGGRTT